MRRFLRLKKRTSLLTLFLFMISVPFVFAQKRNLAPDAVVSASSCLTSCSNFNDLNYWTCGGSQQVWVSTSAPPSSTIGDDYIEWTWATPQEINEIVIHNKDSDTRVLTGAILQYWDGSEWVSHYTWNTGSVQCVNSFSFPRLVASNIRITSFKMLSSQGQTSNPAFREIEVLEAPIAPDDAGLAGVNPVLFNCPGSHPLEVTLRNFGINTLDSVEIAWSVDGVAQPSVKYTGPALDTIGGSGINSTLVTLGNFTYAANTSHELKAWVFNPNSGTDTVNFNDTLITSIRLAAPSGLSASNLSSSSADLSWDTRPGTTYDLIYGPQGFDPSAGGTTVSDVDPPHNLTGLSSNTEYDFYIRADCGSGVYSDISQPETFLTPCTIFSIPFSEDFDSGVLPDCWKSTSDGSSVFNDFWNFNGFANGATHSLAKGTYTFVNGSGFTAREVLLESPRIDVSSLTVPQISFDLYQANSNEPDNNMGFMVNIYDGSTWHNNVFYNDDDLPGGSSRINIPLDIFTITGPIRFQFVVDKTVNGTSFYNDIIVDDLEIIEAPSCSSPEFLSSSSVTSNTASISFLAAGSSFEYEYGPAGYEQGTGTNGIGGRPLNLNGLSPGTSYDVYVRSNCGPGGSLSWTGPLTFTTTCNEVAMPYYESFDYWPPSCMDTTGGDSYWRPFNSFPDDYAHADRNLSPPYGPMYLTTPSIVVDEPAWVRYKWSHYFGSDPFVQNDELRVEVLANGVWDTVSYLRSGDGNFNDPGATATSPGDFTEEVIYLDSALVGDMIKVRIIAGKSSYGNEVFINDFYVEAIPPCPKPLVLIVDTLTANSVTLDLEAIGTETFEYVYDTVGFVPDTNVIGSGGNPLVVNGMSERTAYDIYVRSSCDTDGTSAWVGPVTVTTSCNNLLNGTYTVDPAQAASATNFTSISSALAAVNLCGVSGPVVFNVKQGTYIDQMEFKGHPVLGTIIGSNATNTITFQSDPSNTSMPEIVYSSTTTDDNYVVAFRGESHITIEGIELSALGGNYARVIDFSGNNTHIAIRNNILNGNLVPTNTSTEIAVVMNSEGADVHHTTIHGNEINGGSYSLYWYGAGTTDLETGNTIDSNTIYGYSHGGVWSLYQDNISITSNKITSGDGVYDEIHGIHIEYNDRVEIVGNRVAVYGISTNYGMYLSDMAGDPSSPNLVANNMVSALDNIGATFGMFIRDHTHSDIVYNNVLVGAGNMSNSYVMYVAGNDASYSGVNILNNNLVNYGAGIVLLMGTTDMVNSMDYNNYFAANGTLAYWKGTIYADLAALQSVSGGMNSNSVSGLPVFFAHDDLHLSGMVANNKGVPFARVAFDIDGDPRSATTPDIGADEYEPIWLDIDLFSGVFKKDNPCLSTDDTIILQVQNLIGDTVDFTVDPLTLNYDVTGPVTSSGTQTINTGTLAPQDTLEVIIGGIDLSVVGDYSLNAWIDSSGRNTLSNNDSLFPAGHIELNKLFTVDPDSSVLVYSSDSVRISARAPLLFNGDGKFFFSEVSHNLASTGEPSGGFPRYLRADDYVEITGIPGSDLSGITLEQWGTSSIKNTYTFPSGTRLSPEGTAIIAVGSAINSSPDPSNYYYHGNVSENYGSVAPVGRILKDSSGNIIDAVAYGDNYTFPSSSGVTTAEWSGNMANAVGSSGYRLIGIDDNTATNWVASSSVNRQDPNTLNTNLILPAQTTAAQGFTWSLNGVVVDSVPGIYVGPFTNPGTYAYVATYVSPCGITYTDTSFITAPSCPLPGNLSASGVTSDSATLSWTASNNAGSWTVIYDTAGFDPATGGNVATANAIPFTIDGLTGSSDYEFYIISNCGTDGLSDTAGPGLFTTPCAAPTDLGAIGIDTAGADIFWISNNASSWNVEYGGQGFTPGTGTLIVASNDTFALTGLQPDSCYDFYVQQDCGADSSVWEGPYTFCTNPLPCLAPTNLGATNIERTTTDVFWSGSGSRWNVEYGGQGFVQSTGTMAVSSKDTLALTGLQPDSCYDFYVQKDCGRDSSIWSGPYTFCTNSCPSAGTDASDNICDTLQIDLSAYLNGADTGGNWEDADGTGALSGNIFDADDSSKVTYGNTYKFYYIVSAADCPDDTAVVTITLDSCKIGLGENLIEQSLSIYPNPTSDELNVKFITARSGGVRLSVSDIFGKVVMEFRAKDINGRYNGKLDISRLAKGTYMLKIESNGLIAVRRIVKQ